VKAPTFVVTGWLEMIVTYLSKYLLKKIVFSESFWKNLVKPFTYPSFLEEEETEKGSKRDLN
jgi:hypothetical protein